MVANIYVQDCVGYPSTKQDCRNFFINYLSQKYYLNITPRFQVSSRFPLVLRGVYPFVLALPLTHKEYGTPPTVFYEQQAASCASHTPPECAIRVCKSE